MRVAVAFVILSVSAVPLIAHGGGLDRYGCHNDRKRGGYHCHRGSSAPAPQPRAEPRSDDKPQTLFGGTSSKVEYDADVETAQKLLAKLGYDPGEPDGLMGSKTRGAVRAFQGDNGIRQTGEVTQELISQLIDKVAD